MEQGGGADQIAAALERHAARRLRVFEVLDGSEVAIDQHRIGQGPQMLGRIELGGIGWQEEQMDVVGDAQPGAAMPARAVQDEHDLLGGAGADRASKGRQLDLEQRNGDGRGEMEHGAPRGGMHEPDQVAPVEAVLNGGGGALPVEAPDFVQDGLQADAVLIDAPQLEGGLREGSRYLSQQGPEVFLNACCWAASAATCRGRGMRRLPSSRTR